MAKKERCVVGLIFEELIRSNKAICVYVLSSLLHYPSEGGEMLIMVISKMS